MQNDAVSDLHPNQKAWSVIHGVLSPFGLDWDFRPTLWGRGDGEGRPFFILGIDTNACRGRWSRARTFRPWKRPARPDQVLQQFPRQGS